MYVSVNCRPIARPISCCTQYSELSAQCPNAPCWRYNHAETVYNDSIGNRIVCFRYGIPKSRHGW